MQNYSKFRKQANLHTIFNKINHSLPPKSPLCATGFSHEEITKLTRFTE